MPRKVNHSDSEEMISNGKVTSGEVQKSNGKVKTRLVWQVNRKALICCGKVQSRHELR